MVDPAIFSRRLDALLGYLEKLSTFREVPLAEFTSSAALHDLAERYAHLAVEACLDLGNHYIADRRFSPPASNKDVFTVLELAGELDHEWAERLRGWAGFRNVLVHEYLDIDHGVTYAAIRDDLEDLRRFADWAASKIG